MLDFFKIKLPYQNAIKHKFLMALFYGFLPYTFLLIFKPFGLNDFLQHNKIFVLGYSFIAFAYNFCIYLLMDKISFFVKNWNVIKVILLYFFIVFSISVLYYIYHCSGENLPLYKSINYDEIVFMVIAITLLPTILVVLTLKLNDNKRYFLELTSKKNNKIEVNKVKKRVFKIKTTSLKEQDLIININDFLYVNSDNNYCHFHYLNKDNIVVNKMLRITLKQVESQLKDFKYFLRCHNSYIINTSKIIKIDGNSTNRKIKLKHVNFSIPTSRSLKISALSELLQDNHLPQNPLNTTF